MAQAESDELPPLRINSTSLLKPGRRRSSTNSSGDYQAQPQHMSSPLSAPENGAHSNYGSFSRFRGTRFPSQRSLPGTPHESGFLEHTPLSRQASSFFRSTFLRPKSGYDRILEEDTDETEMYMNGIRFHYSTFTSIDWLHDAIKDSTRVLRLRRRKSLRGRLINALDRSLGWFVVSIVGFFTAVSAFCIVRLEQWLFDIKEGMCADGWYKAKRYCCPVFGPGNLDALSSTHALLNSTTAIHPFSTTSLNSVIMPCSDWLLWSQRIQPNKSPIESAESWIIEYSTYSFFALLLAFVSAILTVYLTASTSFVSSTDSHLPSTETTAKPDDNDTAQAPKRKVLYFAAGSGIPELKCILGGFVMRGYLGARTFLTKAVALPMSVASGLTLGKEGPFVHIACCLGNIVSRWFAKYEQNEAKRREILSAACAAGVAVAFGAPVGGVLFSLEEVSYFFPAKVMWRSFFCAMVAAATLRFLDPFGTGKLVLFQVTYDKDWHAFELWGFLLLGLLGGLYGGYATRFHVWWVKNVRSAKWIQEHPIGEVMAITLLTTLLCFLNPYTRMGGTELVYNLFAECHVGDSHEGLCVGPFAPIMPVIYSLAIAGLIKAALVAITFGIKVPAGVFIPTLGVGACVGRILGVIVQDMMWRHPDYAVFDVCRQKGDKDCVIPGMYAMIGATAALSGMTRTTISLAVIVFELTGSITYAVPVMLSVLVAKTVADLVQPKGIYDCVIELAQLPYLECKHEYLWGSKTLPEIMNTRIDSIRADREVTVYELQEKLLRVQEDDGGFPILVKEERLYKPVGYIGNNELEHALSVVEDEPTEICRFASDGHYRQMTSSFSSLADGVGKAHDPFDFTVYMDQAPVTVNSNSPLELVHQIFTKLGARYVLVINSDGYYEGFLDKKTWIGFVNELPNA